jgi:uncharacterized protein (UPF0335 family)
MTYEIATQRLCLLIERIERLNEEKKNLQNDIKDVFVEAKAAGFDTKAMRQIIKLRKIEKAEREAQEAIIDTYKEALGL